METKTVVLAANRAGISTVSEQSLGHSDSPNWENDSKPVRLTARPVSSRMSSV